MSDFLQEPTQIGDPVPDVQSVSNPQPTTEISDRALQAGNAMIDANDAFRYAGVAPTAEDIRSLAITFLIGEGKDNRTAKIGQQRAYKPAPRPATPAPTNPTPRPQATGGAKLPFFSFQDDIEVTLTVISDDGEFDGKFGANHGFTVEVDGAQYKLTTMSKALLPRLVGGATVTVKKYKEGNFTKYEVK